MTRSTGVTGLDIGVDFDESGQLFGIITIVVKGGDGLVEGGHRSGGHAGVRHTTALPMATMDRSTHLGRVPMVTVLRPEAAVELDDGESPVRS